MGEILDIPAWQVQPFDVVSEGETVRRVTYDRRWTSLEEHLLEGEGEVWEVTLDVGHMRIVEVPQIDLPGSPVLKDAEWGETRTLVYKPDEIVRVARRG